MESKAPPSISAAKQRFLTQSARRPGQKKRGGENVLWKRVTNSFDDAIKKFAANPEIGSPITRLVFFHHLTVTQGMAARRYGDIMRKFRRFHVAPQSTSPRSANLEPVRGAEDQELERRLANGTLDDYEKAAKEAMKQYKHLMKVMDGFKDAITGRNFAKEIVEALVMEEIEPEARHRADIGNVLAVIAKEFGVSERPRRR